MVWLAAAVDWLILQEYIESLPLTNTPEVFGLHTNAEIGYYTNAAKDMWSCLIDLQPQTGDAGAGVSREALIDKVDQSTASFHCM